jgi:putative ABC transport system permease protein
VRSVYRLLLWLYPAPFRRRYEAQLIEAFDQERSDGRYGGLAGRVSLWRHLLGDLLSSARRQRWRQATEWTRQRTGGGLPQLPSPARRSLMESITQDVRYALRQFTRRPGFTAIAVISLALGIGATSLIYGLMDGFVFNPFPYPDPDRLVAIGGTFPRVSSETAYVEALSTPEYDDIRRSRSFSRVAAFDLGNRNIAGGDVPERVFTAFLLDDLFPVIGLAPHLGRGFTAEELAPKGPPAAVISHRLWQSRFDGDPGILNRAIRIGGASASVVGVMPPGLLVIGTDLWMPWGADPALMPRDSRQFTILARLAPGASVESANAELATIAGQVQQAHVARFKEYEGWRLTATPWAAALLRDVRPAAFVLLGAVGFVLLIACANLTNLMLARATNRHRELAVRLALGAARWQIARQQLTESLLLGVAGAAAGLALAHIGLQFAGAVIPAQFTMLDLHAGVNGRVLAWTAGMGVLAGLLVALLPAIQATRTDPHDSLKSDGRAGHSRGGGRVRSALIVAEIALSVVLLLGAGLLLRSVLKMQRAEMGFEPAGVVTMRLTLPQQKYPSGEAITAFFEELIRRTKTIPGVTAAATVSQFPPLGFASSKIEIEGVAASEAMLPTANTTIASRDYFDAVQIPLLRGRLFADSDVKGGPAQVVVNNAFATRYLAGKDPVGARMRVVSRGGPGPWAEIIGVVGDARNNGAGAPIRPEAYIAMEQGRDAWNQLFLVIRSGQDASALIPSVRAVVASIDPEQPVYNIQTMEEAIALSAFQQRISATLLGIFAATALVLAAVGIYGVMSYSVSARTREIGVRMAIGAERTDVMRLVLLQVFRLAALGLAIGVALLIAAGKVLTGLLYGVTPSDPVTIAAVTATLGGVALIAGWVPAWRASRVNPIQALRYE